uniref:Sulfate_transp domain-containing protein n=1 Tax=Rhabditophanes sp. KR3021 TaxID=114890 RepID=A0AC35TG27_9BILA
MGARSQVSALVSATMIFVVIMFAAPLLECLPLAILSSIVLVALIGIFRQVYEVPGLYKTSSVDFII